MVFIVTDLQHKKKPVHYFLNTNKWGVFIIIIPYINIDKNSVIIRFQIFILALE